MNELIDGEVASDRSQQALDHAFVAIDVKEVTNDLRRTSRVHLLHVNLNELDQTVLVQVRNEVVYEIETVADDDERKLVYQFRLLKVVLEQYLTARS